MSLGCRSWALAWKQVVKSHRSSEMITLLSGRHLRKASVGIIRSIFRCQALRRSEGHRTASCLVYLGHHHHRVDRWHYSALLCSCVGKVKVGMVQSVSLESSIVVLSCLVLSQFRQKQYGIVVTASWSKGKDINRIHLALVKRKRGVYLVLSCLVLS